MKTLTPRKSVLLLIATLSLAASASADVIGPWPANTTNMWENSPIPTNSSYNWNGTNYIVPDAANGQYWFPIITTTPKNTSWLPYTVENASWAERLAVGRLILEPATARGNTVHARVFDGSPNSGRHGWTVTLRDNAGRFLDFGIRGYFASAQIKARQFDGSVWTIPGGFIERFRTANDYYVMDFTLNPDNTIHWFVTQFVWDSANQVHNVYYYNGDTTVAYDGISVVELGASTSNETGTGTTYKWTEFSYSVHYKLNIALQNPDVVLNWATNLPSAVLQQTAALPSGWSDVTNAPVVSNNLWTVTLPQNPGGQFFRLRPQ